MWYGSIIWMLFSLKSDWGQDQGKRWLWLCSGAGTKLATLRTLARHSHKRKKIKNMRNANVVYMVYGKVYGHPSHNGNPNTMGIEIPIGGSSSWLQFYIELNIPIRRFPKNKCTPKSSNRHGWPWLSVETHDDLRIPIWRNPHTLSSMMMGVEPLITIDHLNHH